MNAIQRLQAKVLGFKTNSEGGVHFLTGAGTSPSDKYYGFTITSYDTVITGITYLEPDKITGDITAMTSLPELAGLYIPISGGFSDITISAGSMMLFKDID
ncbi:hypothetical protein [Gaoshiqia sediminis]|uniref:Uncharacterized protein n=1 Tax=Gaoshiqia sediminis TaxID=2986998 RepID=A0AA41YET1_9BACT|nr:hypothetical protein [Gaoshiqia sediminis]MCW0484647.1 hypothetical protein [Gaoshiqia sediminis]